MLNTRPFLVFELDRMTPAPRTMKQKGTAAVARGALSLVALAGCARPYDYITADALPRDAPQCTPEQIVIEDVKPAPKGEGHAWKATCGGRRYVCTDWGSTVCKPVE